MDQSELERVKVSLGARITELREAHDLTQEELAESVELSPRQMQRAEAGEANFGVDTLIQIALVLKVDVASLFAPPTTPRERRPGRPTRR